MAKQVETRNRFRIYAEVEAEELGPRLVQLASLGLQNVGYDLITDLITFKGNGDRKVHDTTGDQFAEAWVAEHPTFRALELVNHFRDAERTPGSAYTALRNMVAQDIVVKTAPGMYRRADVRELEAPKEKKPSQRGKHGTHRQEITNLDFIRNAMKGRKRITSAELRAQFKEDGRKENSITPIITKLRAAKQIRDIEPGVYEILKAKTPDERKKEKDRLRSQANRDAAKAARLNGTAPLTEETTHG